MNKDINAVKKIEYILDSSIRLPGGYRIGWDGIIGLIPGVGDIVTTGISSFLIYKAVQFKVPKVIIFRMVINMLIDTVLGAIPIVGDIFDFFWKSNVKNSQLISDYAESPSRVKKNSYMRIAIITTIALAAFFLVAWAAVKLIVELLRLIF